MTEPPDSRRSRTHLLTRRVFLSVLGLVYLTAFVSLWVQIDGLAGSGGILPAAELAERVHAFAASDDGGRWIYLHYPSLCLVAPGDAALHVLCAAGCVLSLLLVGSIAPIPVLVLLWIDYLSLAVACDVFLSFQWDTLLLETGFLAIFLAPARLLPDLSRETPPSATSIWLLRGLLFKFMVASGVVKLTYGDPSWWDGTALTYHYMTQPIPAWTSWYVHHLPEWFHRLSTFATLAIEIVVPVAIFLPGRWRLVPAAAFVGLMATVGLSGNYGFFNLLTAVLCVALADDSWWPARWRKRAPPRRLSGRQEWVRLAALSPVVAVFLFMLGVSAGVDTANIEVELPGAVAKPYRAIAGFRTINSYGLFRVMTKTRPEIVLEGSRDGIEWEPYEFRWKPGDPMRRPSFVEPHMPRLDWQMWFAALSLDRGAMPPWLVAFVRRLAENAPPVTALLERNPFPDAPPRHLRCLLYEYDFTDPEARRADGAWWTRTLKRRVFEVEAARLAR